MRRSTLISVSRPAVDRLSTLFVLLLLACSLLPSAARAQDADVAATPEVTVLSQTTTPTQTSTTIRINIQQDSFLSSRQPNANFGNSQLRIGWSNGDFEAMRILIQFNISAIPRNAVINSAQLNIFQTGSVPGNDRNMDFRAQFMRTSWNENNVTWNNANNLGGDALPLGTITASNGWKTTDVTSIIRTWYSGARSNNGLIVTGDEIPANNRMRQFASRESGGGAPFVTVTFTTACDTIAPTASVNSLPIFSPGQFSVSWGGTDSAPANCAASGIASFDVDYRINGGSWQRWKNQTQSTTNRFQNWANNGDFVEFRARAIDNAGNVQSMSSNPQASTRVDTQPPTVVVNPLPPVTPSQFFTLSWNGSDNLSGVAHYDVQWRQDGGDWQLLLEGTTQTFFQVTGAQNGVTYDFRIRATDNVDNSGSWPDLPQTSTRVTLNSTSTILPFNPSILKPTAPITTSFAVNWRGDSASVAIASYDIFFQFNGGAWRLWRNFPASQTSARFEFASLGFGDGTYGFEAIAINTLGQREPQTFTPEAIMWVDLADKIHPSAFLPTVSNTTQTLVVASSQSGQK